MVKAMIKTSQKRRSRSSSQTCPILKWVFRTPELLTLILATAMYRSRSLKPLARMGSGGMKKRMTKAQRIVIAPATYVDSQSIERISSRSSCESAYQVPVDVV